MGVLADGSVVVGDGTTDPVAVTAFTSSTGLLIHERGGIEKDISAIADGGILVGTGAGTMAIRASALTAGAAGFLTHEVGGLEFDVSAITTDQFLGGTALGTIGIRTAAQVTTSLALTIGTNTQAFGAILDDFNTLGAAASDGQFIVATGAGAFAYEATTTARTSLGVGTGDSPQFTGIELGAATDTTLTRASAGNINIEGNLIYRVGGTDVSVADGGTGSSTAGGARTNLGLVIGTDIQAEDAVLTDIAALTAVADNEFIVGTGAGTYGHESGATARTSIGLGTADTVQFSKLGVGGALTEGTLHVHTATAGAVVGRVEANEIIAENSGDAGISILSPDASTGNLYFGSPADDLGARITYQQSLATLIIGTHLAGGQLMFEVATGAEAARFDANGSLFIGDTANANMTVGLTINQGTNFDKILTFKSSDVGTSLGTALGTAVETDDFLTIEKINDALGGFELRALADDVAGGTTMSLVAAGGTATTVDTNTSVGLFSIFVTEHNGAGALANVADTGNIYSLRCQSGGSIKTRYLVKGDGAIHATNITAGSGDLDGVALDREDDIGLVRMHERTVHNGLGIAMSKWDDQIKVNESDLKRLGVISSEGHFYNMQRMNSLLGGAIWQIHTHERETRELVTQLLGRLALAEHKMEKVVADGKLSGTILGAPD